MKLRNLTDTSTIRNTILQSKKILFINPPVEDFTAYNLWAAPLGLFRILGNMRERGKDVTYLDFLDGSFLDERDGTPPKFRKDGRHSYWRREVEKPEEISFATRKFFRFGASDETMRSRLSELERPDVVLISSGMTYWYRSVLLTARIVGEIFGDVPIMTGGIASTLIPESFRKEGIFPWVGPFEHTSEHISFSPELNELTFFPANLIQGCYMKCSYCSSRLFYPKVTIFDVKSQAESVNRWKQETGKSDVAFYDDALLCAKGKILREFLSVADRSLRFHTPNGLHLREVDEALADLLLERNFKELRFGFETIKNRYDSKSSTDELFKTLEILQKAGYDRRKLGVYLLCGLPGQDPEEVELTIETVVEAGGRPYLSEFSPVPGTPLYHPHLEESLHDFDSEPLLQNNTLSSYRSPVFTGDAMDRLRSKLSSVYRDQDRKSD